MELLLEGRSLTAAEARELAIVNRVTSLGDRYNEVREFAKELAEKPAEALSTLLAARSALHIGLDSYLEEIAVGFEHLPRQQQQYETGLARDFAGTWVSVDSQPVFY